jgi:hypothetical protein
MKLGLNKVHSCIMVSVMVVTGSFLVQSVSAQESVAVRAVMTKEPMPLDDPNAAVWSSAPQAQFPMSPQVHWQNRIQEVTVKDLKCAP